MNCVNVVKAMNIGNIDKTLAIIRYGNRKDTMSYYKAINKACEECNINIVSVDLENMSIEAIQAFLDTLKNCDAILPIKPFPEHIEAMLKREIPLDKDVDNFTGISSYKSCTSEAVGDILKYYKIPTRGTKAVIVGANVGWEIATELKNMGCTIVVCNSSTKDLKEETLRADILVGAVGKKNLITADMVKKGAVVLDVGLDVAEEVREKAYVTPRKDGVGIVTTAILLKHIADGK